ncbi:RES family NAD+ phosphorylase [Fluviispira sanaruensis]|uniref:RES domain-containing protein n=1 Tax=Fluviispira sanaruensis TaxID=2493639 RepID=A0A4P2VVY7_FLUSA|nr:RES family NAD+ phosphorylase [Fluviispira sanaruensis]BBH53735.1 hypothetical protein JCM31447_21830 [Fluviispira sanaruensis]
MLDLSFNDSLSEIYNGNLEILKDNELYKELNDEIEKLENNFNLPKFKGKINKHRKALTLTLDKDSNNYKFWRVRSYKTTRIPKNIFRLKSDIKNPPEKNISEPGRFNEKGISYLYLSFGYGQHNEANIAIAETVKGNREWFCYAEFEVLKTTNLIRLNTNFGLTYKDIPDYDFLKFLYFLELKISEPIYKHSGNNEYLFTNRIADFFKSLGFEGIIYLSAVLEVGLNCNYNLCSFNPQKFDVKNELITSQYLCQHLNNFELHNISKF